MYQLLEMEESDLCSKRGLLSNTEQQTFEMYLPSAVYDQWMSLRKSFNNNNNNTNNKSQPSNIRSMIGLNRQPEMDKAKLVHTYFAINRFLCSFIEHAFANVDYIVQDRSGMESLFTFEFGSVHQKGRLYNGKYIHTH